MIERGKTVVGRLSGGKAALLSHDWGSLHTPLAITHLFPLTHPGLVDLRSMRNDLLKTTKAALRRNRTIIRNYFRNQYYPAMAYADFTTAARQNQDIALNSFMLLLVLGYGFAVTAFDFALLFLSTAYDLSSITGLDMRILLITVMGIMACLGAWVAAFLMNMVSLAIMDGARRKVKRSTLTTVRHSLARTSRVSSAWFMLAAGVGSPLLLGIICAAVIMKSFPHLLLVSALGWSIAVAAVIVWSLINLIRYSLAPYIVLFEPEVSLRQAFKRSSQLISRRGSIFLLTVYALVAACIAALVGGMLLLKEHLGVGSYLLAVVGALLVAIITNGVLVMLYRKRKLARKY